MLKVKGIFDPPAGGSPFGRVTISTEAWDRLYDQPQNIFSFVRMKGGETDANKAALEKQLKPASRTRRCRRSRSSSTPRSGLLKAILNVLFVLLALSVIVSLFGIVNTLVLTVFERTRELGMLRAVGMTRRQTRRMIRHESVITALMGGVIGIILGIILGALLIVRVDEIDFSLPVVTADHLRARDDPRRHHRRDLPGPARGQAERPRGAPVRVAASGLPSRATMQAWTR